MALCSSRTHFFCAKAFWVMREPKELTGSGSGRRVRSRVECFDPDWLGKGTAGGSGSRRRGRGSQVVTNVDTCLSLVLRLVSACASSSPACTYQVLV